MFISSHVESNTYSEVVKYDYWRKAMQCETVLLPNNKTAIGCKWVFKIKYNADETVERYKTRLIVKGYTQTEGTDYFETFSPITKMTTIRLLLSLASIYN